MACMEDCSTTASGASFPFLANLRSRGLPEMSFLEYTWCVQVLRSPKEAFAADMQLWCGRFEKICMSTG